MKGILSVLLLVGCFCIGSCSSSKKTEDSSAAKQDLPLVQRYATLRDALRVQPRLRVNPEGVYLRSMMNSFSSDNQIRFAVSGQVLGTIDQVENTITLQDIKSIRVLESQAASSSYGLLGANGIVELLMIK